MSTKKRKIQTRLRYSESFKKARVAEFESGHFTIAQLSRLYKVGVNTLYKWVYRYSTYNQKNSRIVELTDSASERMRVLEKQVAELERALGRKQLELDFAQALLAELQADGVGVKKKSTSTGPSNESLKTRS